jgi:hypothetical protein
MVAVHRLDDDEEAQRGVPQRAQQQVPRRAPLSLVRCDTLPEDTNYRDTGCELAPSCLNCPLPRCKYDVPRSARRLGNFARDREIAVLRRKHAVPVEAIAATFGLSRRQVYRVLRTQDPEPRTKLRT